VVKEIGDGVLAVKIAPLEPLADPELDIRLVRAGSRTTVVLNKPRDQAEYDKEWEAYNLAIRQAIPVPDATGEAALPTDIPKPPAMNMEEPSELSEIKPKDSVKVFADFDIKEAKEFEAVKIVISRTDALAPSLAPSPIPAIIPLLPAPLPTSVK
jgi:hypothetical protein